ncbi:hypothetical protein FHT86_005536 [Rhizobium sp. BK313]|uniref:hypothetical protein n=1 Tax=Rhizobium sp. BK313 TaxID=2587081 RepID=UPI00105DB78F|nr:hypothetical protein [Rhizobium sp. BK313]MBB3457218.1 hypothetical protein [Rhizobium sp. BK313]
MTDRTLEELKRQMEAARADKAQADTRYNAIAKSYHRARCDRSGLIGKFASNHRYAILIQDITFTGDQAFYFTGQKMRKDGTLDHKTGIVYAQHAKIFEFISHETGALV